MASTSKQGSSERTLWILVFIILLIAVCSVIPWRRGQIYSGGVDRVVAAKAALELIAFGLAFALHATRRVVGSVGIISLSFLAAIIIISTIGAYAADDITASLVLSIRLAIVAATVVLIVKSAPPLMVLNALLAAMGAVAIFAAITGAQHGLSSGRLSGGIPNFQANVLAGLAAPPAVGLGAYIARRGIRPWNIALLAVLIGIVFATGSRTALLVVFIGIIIAFLSANHVPTSTAIAALIATPFIYSLLAFTNTIPQVFSRGQDADQLLSLSTRTVAWNAVFAIPIDSWPKWIGVGLAAKTVAVQERFRNVQVLDSSWVSVLAQAGIIGTLLLGIWLAIAVIESLARPDLRALTFPLLVVLIIRSITESGLVDSSATFLLFLTIALVLEPGTKYPGVPRESQMYQLAKPLPFPVQSKTPTRAPT
jgi:O-Antigen ligase